MYSVTLAVIGLAIAAFTPRRSFATGGIIAFFLVTAIVAQILGSIDSGDLSRYAQLIDIDQVLMGVSHAMFGGTVSFGGRGGDGPSVGADLPDIAYIGVLLAVLVVGTAIIIIRYRRVQA
jgi:ABC-2 type transport system permease protein